MLLLDFLPQYHIRGFADNDPSDRYSLPSGSIRTARHGLLESLCTACGRLVVRTPLVGQALLLIALIWLVIQVKSSDIQPFIYFQF